MKKKAKKVQLVTVPIRMEKDALKVVFDVARLAGVRPAQAINVMLALAIVKR